MTRIASTIATICVLSGCAHFDRAKVQAYAIDKAAKLAECQAQNPLSRSQALACLGDTARDLGTESCGAANQWLDALPTAE